MPRACSLIAILGIALILPAYGLGAAPTTQPATDGQHLVRHYGAVGDGKAKDTQAIQRAIDAAEAAGGGTVRFTPGRYLSGTLRLKSNVTLALDTGATLLGSTDLTDFPEIVQAMRSYTDNYTRRSLIYAENLSNIGITGQGTIDGQGAAFKGPYLVRPYVIRMIACRGIRIEGITLRQSPMWMEHYLGCEDLSIRGIRVFNQCNANNDMMDIDGCRNVIVSDCFGDTEDDGITLKSTADRPTENVSITNCVLSSCCNAIKCGTESNGGFRNITISNCTVKPTTAAGIYWEESRTGISALALETVDGGTLDGVTVSNLSVRGTLAPIFLRLGDRGRPYREGDPKPPVAQFQNVIISNVVATDASPLGCAIAGIPGHPIRNLTLSDIRITFAGGGVNRPAAEVPEQANKYPECPMFGNLPAYGFYCRHIDGLTLRNIQVGWDKPDQRPALLCDDVTNLDIDALKCQLTPEAPAAVVLRNVRNAILRGCRAPSNATAFLHLDTGTLGVSLFNSDLADAKSAVTFGKDVPQTALHQSGNREPPR